MSESGKAKASAATGGVQLRVAHVWLDEVMDDQVITTSFPVTLGHQGHSTFTIPDVGLPQDFAILRPGSRGWVLTLGADMGGHLSLGGEETTVERFLEREGRKGSSAGEFHATPIKQGDWGVVELDSSGDHTLFFQFVREGAPIVSWQWRDLELVLPALALSIILHTVLLAGSSWMFPADDNALVFPGRRDLMSAYLVERPPPPEEAPEDSASPDGEKEKVKPAATKGKKGKDGGKGDKRANDPDAPELPPDTPEVGLLEESARQTIENTLNRNIDARLARSLNRLDKALGDIGAGAGSGSGVGDSLLGSGTSRGAARGGSGGGGRVAADVVSNKLDTGGTRKRAGSGGTGTGLGERAVVSTEAPTGNFSGLTKAEIAKVVNSRKGFIRACYQAELNRTRGLGGKLMVNFRIKASGQVGAVRVVSGKSSLRNAKVESCIKRQIARLKFPAKGSGAVVDYPFIFKKG